MRLKIDKAVYGGSGLGRIAYPSPGNDSQAEGASAHDPGAHAGKAAFVPYTLPGEVIEARITENRRSFVSAEMTALIEPSPHRVVPGCEYFTECGGCHYQHALETYQLQMKAEILRDTFARAHVNPIPEEIEVISDQPWGYRNRVRLQVRAKQNSGQVDLCYRRRGSHQNLPVTHCPIAAPLINLAIEAVRSTDWNGLELLCGEIEFFTNGNQDALLLSLWIQPRASLKEALALTDAFCSRLHKALPQLVGCGVFATTDETDRLLGHWGERALDYTVLDRHYQVSLGSFFQVNRFLLPRLVQLVAGLGLSGHLAWDLYAGAGLFSLALDFEQVIAVEAAAASFADLKRNLTGTSHRAVSATTRDFLRSRKHTSSQKKSEERPDLIVLDPPRAGLGPEVCSLLSEIEAPAILYVSCDPATLARDLQALLQSGYRIGILHVVDLFPQTFHLETVTALVRA
jgi:23S rRNA (uracil1939-C5)-methyltransferase